MDYLNKIDEYLGGHLTENEQKLFEKELNNNPLLRKKVKLCQELKDAIIDDEVALLRQKLAEVTLETSHKRSPNILLITVSVAASLLVLFSLKLFFTDTGTSKQKLFSDNYKPFELVGEFRDANKTTSDSLLDVAKRLYTEKNYQEVVAILEDIRISLPNNYSICLMLVTSYLELGKPEIAEELILQYDTASVDLIYRETIEWYFALVLLKLEQNEKLRQELQKIVDQNGLYSRQAASILRSL